MKRTLVYVAVCSVATADLIYAGYANAKTDNNKVTNIEKNLQSIPAGWQLVKQTFQLHIPKNGNALSELIIDVPSTIAVSNDIDILDDTALPAAMRYILKAERYARREARRKTIFHNSRNRCKGQKIKINISVNSRRIIIDFYEPVTSSTTKLQINLNKVQQPILGSTSIYHLSAKVVGNDVEISIGEAQFPTF